MKLEKQVCSLELSKQLKKLGVKQDSLFYYDLVTLKPTLFFMTDTQKEVTGVLLSDVSAFTVAELGEMLPSNRSDCVSEKEINGDWRCGNQIEKTEADARAKMLIYLIENNLTK